MLNIRKDRYLHRATYLEYLPSDFNTKNQLVETIKSINANLSMQSSPNKSANLNDVNRSASSRQTATSTFSLFQENELSSDDERFDKIDSERVESSK